MGKKTGSNRRQVSFSLSEDLVAEIEKQSKESGLTMNAIVNLRLKGYNVVRKNDRITGVPSARDDR